MSHPLISDAAILYTQITAALFMCADYFLKEERRESANTALQQATAWTKRHVAAALKARFDAFFAADLPRTLVTLAMFAAAISGFAASGSVFAGLGPWTTALAALLLLFLFAGSAPHVLALACYVGAWAMLALPVWLAAAFVHRCPKGSVFGIGMLFLAASFACRWLNLP